MASTPLTLQLPEGSVPGLGADHGFEVLKRSGRTDAEVIEELVMSAAEWMAAPAGANP